MTRTFVITDAKFYDVQFRIQVLYEVRGTRDDYHDNFKRINAFKKKFTSVNFEIFLAILYSLRMFVILRFVM